MTSDEFRKILADAELSQSEFARLVGVTGRNIRRYAAGELKPTGPVVALLRLIERRPELLKVLRESQGQ